MSDTRANMKMEDTSGDDTTPSRTAAGLLGVRAASFVATAILIAFGVFVVWMLSRTGRSDTEWSRSAYIYGSVEAIVFAAVGALFGTQIQGRQVQRLEQDKARADQQAESAAAAERIAAERAIRGDALAASTRGLLRAKQATATEGGPASRLRGAGGPSGASAAGADSSGLEELAAIVDELFPGPARS